MILEFGIENPGIALVAIMAFWIIVLVIASINED